MFEEYIESNNAYAQSKSLKVYEIHTIEFKDVFFKYNNQAEYTLKDINFSFCTGEKIAIVGQNGAGKSTLIKLLLQIYKPSNGKILLNGIDINEIDYEQYISFSSGVFQDFKLFSFSLKENIEFELDDNDRLEEILKTVGLYDKVNNLNKGSDAYIYKDFDHNGYTPSGGEAQKIAMARAYYKNSKIIILNEPASSKTSCSKYGKIRYNIIQERLIQERSREFIFFSFFFNMGED